MSDTIVCPTCSTSNPFGKKFCAECGGPLKGAAWASAEPEDTGFVSGGVWQRPPTEFVRRVRPEEMQSRAGRLGLEVPRGTVAVLVRDGRVEEVLPPGKQVAVGWLDRVASLFSDKVARTDFYLIDVRALPIPFTVDARSASGAAVTRYQVLVEVQVKRDDRAALAQFLEQFGAADSVSQRTLYDHLRQTVEAAVRPHLAGLSDGAGDLARVEAALTAELRNGAAGRAGLEVSVRVSAVAASVSVDLHLGDAPAPAKKKCVKCSNELESSKKFCNACGEQQPLSAQPARVCAACAFQVPAGKKFCPQCGTPFVERAPEAAALYTKDGKQVELDLVLRAEGDRAAASADRIGPTVAGAASKHLRRFDFSALATEEGFRQLEQGVLADVSAALRALGLAVTEVTVLDVRAKGEEWLLRGRAELDQAQAEVLLGREWLASEEQSLDLKVLGFDMALRNQRTERDHRFHQQQDEVADRRRQQGLADETANLDVADAARGASRSVRLDAAERSRDRAIAGEAHTDQLSDGVRAQERGQQADGFRREREMNEAAHERGQESRATEHELGQERRVADHDAELARQAMRLGSEKGRVATDDRSYSARSGIDTDAYATKARGEAEVTVARSKQELELEAEARRRAMRREDQQASVDAQAKLEAMERLADLQREEQARLTHLQRAEQERLTQQATLDHDVQMRQALKGQSAEEILAMQSGGEGGKAVAAAFAEKFKAEAAGAAAVATAAQQAAAQAQMMQLVQMMHTQSAQQMQVLGNVATAAVGGQKESDAARQAALGSAAQANLSMAERAIDGLTRPPAGARARAPEEAPVAPPVSKAVRTCGKCGAAMSDVDKCCGECGWRS